MLLTILHFLTYALRFKATKVPELLYQSFVSNYLENGEGRKLGNGSWSFIVLQGWYLDVMESFDVVWIVDCRWKCGEAAKFDYPQLLL